MVIHEDGKKQNRILQAMRLDDVAGKKDEECLPEMHKMQVRSKEEYQGHAHHAGEGREERRYRN